MQETTIKGIRVDFRVPCGDGTDEVVDVGGESIVDALHNALVAYGDAELVLPVNVRQVVFEQQSVEIPSARTRYSYKGSGWFKRLQRTMRRATGQNREVA